jgi:hypothetical protein
MAGGAFVDSGAGGKEYPGKLTLYVFFTCIVAATGGLIFGYDIGISGKYSSKKDGNIFFFLVGNIKKSCTFMDTNRILELSNVRMHGKKYV